jgi:cyclophilin family peptidyl-prolyl cis-trans isomerase
MIQKPLLALPALVALASLALPALCQAGPKVALATSHGEITLELDEEKAPKTVANFLEYVNAGFYDNTVFHRVIKDFMIQGGGFELGDDGEIRQKETRDPVENEAKNGLKNARGTIAMARTNDPHSATAQFFINHGDNANLDHPSFDGWGYAVFGKVVDGIEVVDQIAALATGMKALETRGGKSPMRDVPEENVVILSAKVVEE